jgi:prepilin-type processing-associated H-X9-DG protein
MAREEWNWTYHILPYLEQAPLYQNPNHTVVANTDIKTYFCPSRRGYDPATPCRGDYAGNAGVLSNGSDGLLQRTGTGVLRLADVTDGTTSTLMVSEKRLKLAFLAGPKFTYDNNESYYRAGWDSEVFRRPVPDRDMPSGTTDRGPNPDIPPTITSWPSNPDPYVGLIQFGSSHRRGVNAVMADGSVRMIKYQPSPRIFLMLCTRNDGVPQNYEE